MNPAEDSAEPERSYPSSGLRRLLILNGLIVALIAGLIVIAQAQEGYLGGLGQFLAAMGLVGLGALLNVMWAFTGKGSRSAYLVVATCYGLFFWIVMSGFHPSKIGG